jgi:Glycosyl transferases group 1
MNRHFASDPFPAKPRILFIGLGENSHTHSWIDLLEGVAINARLFAMPTGVPPDDWPVRTYVTAYVGPPLNSATRASLYSTSPAFRFAKRQAGRARGLDLAGVAGHWLAKIIRHWRPHIIHTLGIVQGGEFYLEVRRKFRLEGIGRWVLQTRGGSDVTVPHLDPVRRKRLAEILTSCDQLISDNVEDLRIARELGVRQEQIAPIAPVPGAGGIDVDSMRLKWHGQPSRRRVIVWPKAYDSAGGKMLPTFEALKLCWDRIQPCEIHMLSMTSESFMWFWTLPDNIRQSCRTYDRIPRSQVLDLMPAARVMLAPALMDGVPNSLYEGMAAGALPIVSPLETLLPIVRNEENVLFARNLYPQEIAEALEHSMTDDELVDAAAERNLGLLRRVADRSAIRPRVIEFYERLARDEPS